MSERAVEDRDLPGGGDRPEPRAVSTLNVANLLTLSRLLVMVPVFVVALFAGGGHDLAWRAAATALFVLASLTDQIDGWLARRYSLVTDFGKIVDPIADKALIGAALIGLSLLGELPWWVTIVIAARELGVTLLRFLVISYGVIAASPGGKAKTLMQIVAIVVYLLPLPDSVAALKWALLSVALVLTIGTGVDYVFRAVRLRATARA